MRKRIATMIGTLASLVLLYCILFTSLQVTMNSSLFLQQEYKKLNLTRAVGMSNDDIVASTKCLVDYMEGRVDSIDIMVTVNGEETLMYTDEQEVSHMADVRVLYQRFRTYRDYGVLAALLLYLFAAVLSIRTAPHSIAMGYVIGAFILLAAIGFVGTWAALDFTRFWTFFHTSLFWNDDWLFDPATSRMINILPEQFFSDIILAFAIMALAVVVLLLIAALLLLHGERKRKKAAREEYLAAKKAKNAARKAEAAEASDNADKESLPLEGKVTATPPDEVDSTKAPDNADTQAPSVSSTDTSLYDQTAHSAVCLHASQPEGGYTSDEVDPAEADEKSLPCVRGGAEQGEAVGLSTPESSAMAPTEAPDNADTQATTPQPPTAAAPLAQGSLNNDDAATESLPLEGKVTATPSDEVAPSGEADA